MEKSSATLNRTEAAFASFWKNNQNGEIAARNIIIFTIFENLGKRTRISKE
jgi:hypothetical protein